MYGGVAVMKPIKTSFSLQQRSQSAPGLAHLVNELVVQESMDPVDAHVSEEQEGDHADDDPRPT